MIGRRSRHPWTVALLIAGVALLTACGGPVAGLLGGDDKQVDACALVTKADAERILGQAIGAVDDPKDGTCQYTTADEAQTLGVSIVTGDGARELFEITMLPFGGQPMSATQEVAGLGDRAQLVLIGGDGSGTMMAPVTILSVLKQDRMVMLTVGDPTALEPALTGPPQGSLDALKAVAKRVIDQL